MAAKLWRSEDLAILVSPDCSWTKVEVVGPKDGFAVVRILGTDTSEVVDPACLVDDSVLGTDASLEQAVADTRTRRMRMLLAEAARLVSRRASDTNISIYDSQNRGRAVSIREGGTREACFSPPALILSYSFESGGISGGWGRIWDDFARNPAPYRNFLEKFGAAFPSGDIQIWGAEYGSDVV